MQISIELFEPGFLFGDCYCRVDILVPQNGTYDIIEVKSSTKVKDINYHDVAFQKFVLENCGLKIGKCFVMHLNSSYVRSGALELDKLFVVEEVTSEVDKIEVDVNPMLQVINGSCPSLLIGQHCKDPYLCPLISDCNSFLGDSNVLELYRGGKKSYSLVSEGVNSLKEIPSNFKLTSNQAIQVKCALTGKCHVDVSGVRKFLSSLEYPLYYLDFETFSLPVPAFDNCSPYTQVCFQFSLHVVDKEGSVPVHYEWLYSGSSDPRSEFVNELLKVLGSKGSIVVYNQSFEAGRLKELGSLFPEQKEWVSNVVSRFVDLLDVFRNFLYYNPKQKGSASIKKVLPALVGGSYSDLGISDGASASVQFYKMCYCGEGEKCVGKLSSSKSGLSGEGLKSEKDKDKGQLQVREDLLKYCCLDTKAMVDIVGALREVVDGGKN